MKHYLTFIILFSITSCKSTETIPQPKEIDIKMTIQENLEESKQAQMDYKVLQRKRKQDNKSANR